MDSKSWIRNDRPLLKFITGRINVTMSWEVRRKGRCRNRWLLLRDSCNPKFDNVITYCNLDIKKKFNFLLDIENIECPFLLFSQISTDIWFFVAFNILVIRVHPCPQNGNSYTFKLTVGITYLWMSYTPLHHLICQFQRSDPFSSFAPFSSKKFYILIYCL